ncbi:hypothetical protein WME91_52975 [Sorangium sp. So ce269]
MPRTGRKEAADYRLDPRRGELDQAGPLGHGRRGSPLHAMADLGDESLAQVHGAESDAIEHVAARPSWEELVVLTCAEVLSTWVSMFASMEVFQGIPALPAEAMGTRTACM